MTKLISGKEAAEAQLAEAEDKLSDAQALLSSARGSFPKVGASIEYSEVLAELANFYNLEITSMTSDEPRQKKIGDFTFITVAFDVEVRGEMNSIMGMVSEIATDERFVSATVEAVTMKVPETTVAGEEPEKPSAKVELVGYSYGGE